MKVVVVGSKGMFAKDLIPIIAKEHKTLSFDKNQVDITDKKSVFDLVGKIRPDLIINCAAYSLVDQAETDREAAFRVNAYGVQQLALACEEFGSALCHFSTDYVFDGKNTRPYRPDDEPNPISVYGESKRAGEVFLQSILNRYYLIRTSSLYGRSGNNFVHAISRLAKKKEPLRVVQDQVMSPTWTVNLAQGVAKLIHSGKFGVYHLTDRTHPPATARPARHSPEAKPTRRPRLSESDGGQVADGHERAGGGISWFEFATEILKVKGLLNEIEPTTRQQFIRPAKRPAYSVLDTSLFTLCCGYEPMPWQESLKRFLDMI
jgi:dTDP-4-dehydrorhamnose reductase